jgi:hypothetical protein
MPACDMPDHDRKPPNRLLAKICCQDQPRLFSEWLNRILRRMYTRKEIQASETSHFSKITSRHRLPLPPESEGDCRADGGGIVQEKPGRSRAESRHSCRQSCDGQDQNAPSDTGDPISRKYIRRMAYPKARSGLGCAFLPLQSLQVAPGEASASFLQPSAQTPWSWSQSPARPPTRQTTKIGTLFGALQRARPLTGC